MLQLDALIDEPKLHFYSLAFKREDAEDTGQGLQMRPLHIFPFSLLSLSSQRAGPYLPSRWLGMTKIKGFFKGCS